MKHYSKHSKSCGIKDQINELADKYLNSDSPNANMCDNFPDCVILAHAYVPQQVYRKAFPPSEALMKGTLFPELWGVYRIPK